MSGTVKVEGAVQQTNVSNPLNCQTGGEAQLEDTTPGHMQQGFE